MKRSEMEPTESKLINVEDEWKNDEYFSMAVLDLQIPYYPISKGESSKRPSHKRKRSILVLGTSLFTRLFV